MGRLYASTYYALHDTRTPLRFAILRVVLTIGLGYLFALPLPRALGLEPRWGAAGLTASAGMAGWVEFAAAAAGAQSRGSDGPGCRPRSSPGSGAPPRSRQPVRSGHSASASGSPARCWPPLVLLSVYGAVYFFVTDRLGIPEPGR